MPLGAFSHEEVLNVIKTTNSLYPKPGGSAGTNYSQPDQGPITEHRVLTAVKLLEEERCRINRAKRNLKYLLQEIEDKETYGF